MSETLSSVDSSVEHVFSAPEFNAALCDWRQTRLVARCQADKLFTYITKKHPPDYHRSQYQTDTKIKEEWWDVLETDPQRLADRFSYDPGLVDLASSKASADAATDEMKAAVLDKAKELGISPFARYGLGIHMGESDISNLELRQSVAEVEKNFLVFDDFIKNHAGKVLTMVEMLSGIRACRLSEGGITLDEDQKVIIPTRGICYSMSHSERITQLFEEERMRIDARAISDGKERLFDTWAPLLDIVGITKPGAEIVFAVGDPLEGPPIINQEQDREYYQRDFERTRTVGRAVLLNS